MTRSLFAGAFCLLAGCQCLTCEGPKYKEGPKSHLVHKDECRAGCPAEVSPCAHPSDTGRYIGYQVGGGRTPCCGHCGDGPTADEGTWGWDYAGFCFPSKIVLGWWHGLREQGGQGDYRTDGPRPLRKLEQLKEHGEEGHGEGHAKEGHAKEGHAKEGHAKEGGGAAAPH